VLVDEALPPRFVLCLVFSSGIGHIHHTASERLARILNRFRSKRASMFASILNFRAGGAEPAAEPSADCKRRPAKMRAGFRFEARKTSHLNKLEHLFACPPLHLHV